MVVRKILGFIDFISITNWIRRFGNNRSRSDRLDLLDRILDQQMRRIPTEILCNVEGAPQRLSIDGLVSSVHSDGKIVDLLQDPERNHCPEESPDSGVKPLIGKACKQSSNGNPPAVVAVVMNGAHRFDALPRLVEKILHVDGGVLEGADGLNRTFIPRIKEI